MLTNADRTCIADRLNRDLSPLTRYQGSILDAKTLEIERQVERWWSGPSSDGTRWLALGLETMFDAGFVGSKSAPAPSREDLAAKFNDFVLSAEDPHPDWSIAAGQAWIQVTPYTLWQMVEDAREAGVDAISDVMFEVCQGDDRSTGVAKAIRKSFESSISAWEQAVKASVLGHK